MVLQDVCDFGGGGKAETMQEQEAVDVYAKGFPCLSLSFLFYFFLFFLFQLCIR